MEHCIVLPFNVTCLLFRAIYEGCLRLIDTATQNVSPGNIEGVRFTFYVLCLLFFLQVIILENINNNKLNKMFILNR